MTSPSIGLMVELGEPTWSRSEDLGALAAAGIDHVATADHVSFRNGSGRDGLIDAAGLLGSGRLPVYVGLYLLALRHPVLVARQLSTLAETAPGRLVLGVGLGGEDRHEVEVCGVDPRTRGRRMDECLTVLRALLAGGPVTHRGDFFDLDEALVLPAPSPAVPIVVGGRSDAALDRTGRLGDGWLGIWVSARRYAEVVSRVAEIADRGRALRRRVEARAQRVVRSGRRPGRGPRVRGSRDECHVRAPVRDLRALVAVRLG